MKLVVFLGVSLVAAVGCSTASNPDAPDAGTSLDASSTSDAAVAEFALTVELTGEGTGTVSSSPAGIDCPGDCDNDYPNATSVTLTATASAGSTFYGWSGGGCSGIDPCVVTVSAATNVTAAFTLSIPALTVTKDGTGTGTVTSEPIGISCGETCTTPFDADTLVTLTAEADNGSVFTGWSGGGCSGIDSCVVTVTNSITVVASFDCSGSLTFDYTGAAQDFIVPTCVTSLTVDALGASGGSGDAVGGLGGQAQGSVAVTGGEALVIMVGGVGVDAPTAGDAAGFRGGFNGGGDVFEYISWTGQAEGLCGTGGGASDVRRGGSELANRIIVAAGGGGGGGGSTTAVSVGGAGGGLVGEDAVSSIPANFEGGGGGTQLAGGVAFQCCGVTYPNEGGILGQGGVAYRDATGSGGGGGGYFGGGAGSFDGGGGGSSFIEGLTAASTTPALNNGDGSIVLSW